MRVQLPDLKAGIAKWHPLQEQGNEQLNKRIDKCQIVTIWLFNIAMENHHFQWVNPL